MAIGLVCMMHLKGQTTDSIGNGSYRAARTDASPHIDGVLDDACWEDAGEWSGTFTQQQPDEGKPETEETHVKILYDDHNIYVAFRAYDAEPEKINRWTTPRDQIKGDWVGIMFDSYADRRTGFCFVLTAGGTRCDLLVVNNDNDDETWNVVWDGKTSIDGRGWYAEICIPLSQLRYSAEETQEWGFHAIRSLDRKQEQSHLHLIPRSNKGYVYSFARLTGISGLPRSRHIELMPYTSLKYSRSPAEAGNPYATGSRLEYGAGLDGKIGLSSDFMLDFTLNPDFGQVEADPSTINLTAYETYYDEKRPFFLEGKNIFTNMLVADGAMFYSRRIGSPPSWHPEEKDGQYSFVPQQTHIISAMKVSGKTKKGLSAGLLNSLTAKESARITDPDGREYKMTAQPFASYSAVRLQQDINDGNTVIGGLVTSVNRLIRDDHLSSLVRNAYLGAFDFEQYFFKRNYFIRGSLAYSRVEGERDALVALQRSAVHNFQREGAAHVAVDSSRTHLSGTSGTVRVGKGGESKWQTGHTFSWRSPGFESNDAGYLQNADEKRINGWIAYVENTPKGIFRRYTVDPFYNIKWDCGNTNTFGLFGLEADMNFINKWYMYVEGFYESRHVDNSMLRGGPPVKLNPRWGTDLNIETDNSRKVWAQAYHGTMFGEKRYAQYLTLRTSYRPISNLGLSAIWNYTYRNLGLEYVGKSAPASGGTAYVMGALRQRTTGVTLRMDYSITPDLSIQFYGNPFISTGKYSEFKRATNTIDRTYARRFDLLDDDMLTYSADDKKYSVTDGDGRKYSFDNPDFSFREFRFNLVMRWEYRPNSVVYLVWAQNRSGRTGDYVASFSRNTQALFECIPDNTFMLKLNYWFSL
jgi:hypothetical protein